ncbi:hypothetical protein IAD21_06245 [Abditibacteriota bacterium]|nr:hypothetical protein IAD21_06245 [Abditibacteriota bacterium]
MKNRYLAALSENANVIGMASVVALAAAVGSVPVLLAGLVAEAAYLIFVPDSRWFETRLSARNDAEIEAHRQKIKDETLPRLRPSLRTRYEKLEQARREIEQQAANDKKWMREVLRKLDFLLEKFLQFALKDQQFRNYLLDAQQEVHPTPMPKSRDPLELNDKWTRDCVQFLQATYTRDLDQLQAQHDDESDDSTKAILEKRLEVLGRRRDFIARIGKIVANLTQQLALLEDTFGLISDELLARAPEQVLGDIDDVVSQTNAMTQVLEELAPFERMLSTI